MHHHTVYLKLRVKLVSRKGAILKGLITTVAHENPLCGNGTSPFKSRTCSNWARNCTTLWKVCRRAQKKGQTIFSIMPLLIIHDASVPSWNAIPVVIWNYLSFFYLCFCWFIIFHHLSVLVHIYYYLFPDPVTSHAFVFPSNVSVFVWSEPEHAQVCILSLFGHFRIFGIFRKFPSPLVFWNSRCYTNMHSN